MKAQMPYRARERIANKVDPRFRGPFDIADLDPGLWLQADDIAGLSNGDPVTTWEDSGTFERDYVEAGAFRPTYQTNVINGLPVVRFDGTQRLVHSVGWMNNAAAAYVYVVIRTTTAQNLKYIISWPNAAGANGFDLFLYNTGERAASGLQTGAYTESQVTFTYSGGGAFILASRFLSSTGSHTLTVNNTGITTASNSGFTRNAFGQSVIGNFSTGLSAYFTGDIGEIIADNTVIGATAHNGVVQYLAQKWGIAL